MKMHNPPHPGEVLRELCLKPLNLTVTEAARALGVSRKTLAVATSLRYQDSSGAVWDTLRLTLWRVPAATPQLYRHPSGATPCGPFQADCNP